MPNSPGREILIVARCTTLFHLKRRMRSDPGVSIRGARAVCPTELRDAAARRRAVHFTREAVQVVRQGPWFDGHPRGGVPALASTRQPHPPPRQPAGPAVDTGWQPAARVPAGPRTFLPCPALPLLETVPLYRNALLETVPLSKCSEETNSSFRSAPTPSGVRSVAPAGRRAATMRASANTNEDICRSLPAF